MSLFITILAAILIAKNFDKIMSSVSAWIVKAVGYFFVHPIKATLITLVGGYLTVLIAWTV